MKTRRGGQSDGKKTIWSPAPHFPIQGPSVEIRQYPSIKGRDDSSLRRPIVAQPCFTTIHVPRADRSQHEAKIFAYDRSVFHSTKCLALRDESEGGIQHTLTQCQA